MLTEARVVELVVHVSDLARSHQFYEHRLGMKVIDDDADGVRFDAGRVTLTLRSAADHGISLSKGEDTTADVVFLVDDLNTVRSGLEARGVTFKPTSWYEIGGVADFYDPDGHWLSLYQPSDEAMSWPSAEKIRAIAAASDAHSAPSLAGKPLVYLFLFVRDAESALSFYSGVLGLRDVEGGPCSRDPGGDPDDVVKYDVGGMLLATHHVQSAPASTTHFEGVAPVFHVADLAGTAEALRRMGVRFDDRPVRSRSGLLSRFEDPMGHAMYLLQPSVEEHLSPGREKIEHLSAASP